MNVPYWLLRLLPMWEYICPACRKGVKQSTHQCPHCGEKFPLTIRVPPTFLKDPKKLEAYVHKHVFPRVSAFERNYLTKYFTVLFSDGFESGNFNAWSLPTAVGSGTITVVSTSPHHGSYHANASVNAVANAYALAGTNLASPQSVAYLRCYVQFRTAFPAANLEFYVATRLYAGTWPAVNALNSAIVYNDNGTVKWGLRYINGAGLLNALSSVIPSLNQWYCVEIGTVVANLGSHVLYVDGVLLLNLTGIDTNDFGNIQSIAVGEMLSTGANAHETWIDCVVVADARIYCEVPKGTIAIHAKLAGII